MALKKTAFDEGGQGTGKVSVGQFLIVPPPTDVLVAGVVGRQLRTRAGLDFAPSKTLNIGSCPMSSGISNDY